MRKAVMWVQFSVSRSIQKDKAQSPAPRQWPSPVLRPPPISLKPARRSGSCRSCLFFVVRRRRGGFRNTRRPSFDLLPLTNLKPFLAGTCLAARCPTLPRAAEPHIPASAAPVSWRTRATPRETGVATSLRFPFACVCKMVLKRLANFRTRGRPRNEPRVFFERPLRDWRSLAGETVEVRDAARFSKRI
jgi:hypothetical protein